MKAKKTAGIIFNLIGVVISIIIFIFGCNIQSNPPRSYSPDYSDSVTFGADFYTYQYGATKDAVTNTAVTANNIRELGEAVSEYVGIAFVFTGILCALHFVKSFVFCLCESKPSNTTIAATPINNISEPSVNIPAENNAVEESSSDTSVGVNEWKCPNCGKVNQNYVGTCGCGTLKP